MKNKENISKIKKIFKKIKRILKDKEILKKGKKNDQTKTLKTVKNKGGGIYISYKNKRNIGK